MEDCIICLEKKECVNMNKAYKCSCQIFFCEYCWNEYEKIYKICPTCRKRQDVFIEIEGVPNIPEIPVQYVRNVNVCEKLWLAAYYLYLTTLFILASIQNIYIDFSDTSTKNVYSIYLTEISAFISASHIVLTICKIIDRDISDRIMALYIILNVYLLVSLTIALEKQIFNLWSPMYFYCLYYIIPVYCTLFVSLIYKIYLSCRIYLRY